jgi:WD40 repeat protein
MYHAFISYSHAVDNRLAPVLQSAVRRFASPWYRRSALRIFRDQTDLSVSPGLWSSIEQALATSQHLILLASPRAAASRWVRRELEYWLAHNTPQTLLIVLTEGTFEWSEAHKDFDWERTDALPNSLAGAFSEEPLYLDLRSISRAQDLTQENPPFRDAVASLASVLLGRSKDELIGDDIAVRRRARQTLWGVGTALVSLTVLLAVSTRFALSQRDSLARSLQVVQGQKLAAEAQLVRAQSPSQLQLSALLSLEAARLAPSAEVTAQLRQTVALLLPPVRQFELSGSGGSTSAIAAIAFSADSRSLAAVGVGATPRWLDIATGQAVQTFVPAGPEMMQMAVATTPDGSQVITSSLTGISFWNAADGKVVKQAGSTSGSVRTMALSSDGRYLAIGHYEGAVRVLDRLSGRELLVGKHDSVVNSVDFGADAKLLASGSNDNSVRIWSVLGSREVQRLPHAFGVLGVAFSPDGKLVATAGWEGLARIWELATGRQIASFDHRSAVNAVAFSTDGNRLATAGTDATVRVWDRVTGIEVARATHEATVAAVKFSPDGRYIATASKRTVALWATAYGNELVQLHHPDAIVVAVGFSPDGKRLITAAADTARVWSLNDGRELYRLKHDAQVDDVIFSPESGLIETITRPKPVADSSACAHRWDAASRALQKSLCPGLSAMAFNQDGRSLVFADMHGQVNVQDLATGTSRVKIKGIADANFQSAVAVSIRHRYAAVATDAQDVARLHLADATGNAKPRVISLDSRANALAFDAEERVISAGTQNGVGLWDVVSGRELGRVSLAEGATSVAISSDGRHLATGGRDQSVRIWEIPAFIEVARFEMGGNVNRVAFSPDNKLVAAASSDRTARVWRWKTDPFQEACSRLTRNLTLEEWRTYLGDLSYRRTCTDIASTEQQEPSPDTGPRAKPASR